jgi:hypothetical protein
MLKVVNIPTGNIIAQFSTEAAAEAYVSNIETTPPSHEIIGDEALDAKVNDYE